MGLGGVLVEMATELVDKGWFAGWGMRFGRAVSHGTFEVGDGFGEVSGGGFLVGTGEAVF